MIDETDWPRLARYFAGECSLDEAAEMRSWIGDDAERIEQVAVLREVWEESGRRAKAVADQEAFDSVAAWAAVVARKRMQAQVQRELMFPGSPGSFRRIWQIAAAIAVLGGGALLWRAARPDRSIAENLLTMREVVTQRGQRAQLTLNDGTRVVLSVDSKLRFPRQFDGRSREVYLKRGEAYFEVRYDEHRPFLVHAANAVAKDLGTEFSVRAYPEDGEVQVVVAEGEVALSGRGSVSNSTSAVLTSGQLGRLDRKTERIEVQNVDPAVYLAWVQGKLVFDNTPLPQVLAQLARWYDVEFRLEDASVVTRPLTASFERESIGDVLEVIAPSLDLRVRQEGRVVILSSRK